MTLIIKENYGTINQFNNCNIGTMNIGEQAQKEQPQQSNEPNSVPINIAVPSQVEEQPVEVEKSYAEEEPLNLFLVNESHSLSDCEWMLRHVFEMSRSKKMVCEELYKLEGIYFKLNSVEREKRVKWLNSQPSRWQGEFKYEDMKYWRKTK